MVQSPRPLARASYGIRKIEHDPSPREKFVAGARCNVIGPNQPVQWKVSERIPPHHIETPGRTRYASGREVEVDRVGCRQRKSLKSFGIEFEPNVVNAGRGGVPVNGYQSATAGRRALSYRRLGAQTVRIEHIAAGADHPERAEIPGSDRLVDNQ